MRRQDNTFRERVQALVAMIPPGRVMTYGHIAAMCGSPRAARIVGGIAHWGDPDIPWQRVVKKNGALAEGYPGGIAGHERVLTEEGITFNSQGHVNMKEHQWQSDL